MQYGTGKVKGNRQRLEERVAQCSHRGKGHPSAIPKAKSLGPVPGSPLTTGGKTAGLSLHQHLMA